MATTRVGIRLPQDLADHYEQQASKLGISRTACMIMDMRKAIEQSKAIDVLGDLMTEYKKEKARGAID